MSSLSFQVIEGLEAGRVYDDLSTPLTIGREEDNDIQLNDERISRFHAKVQNDAGRWILTDLDSTNGTRVNGHPIRMRVLRPGDLIMVGRCVLLVGGPDLIETMTDRLARQAAAAARSENSVEPIEAGDYSEAFPDGPPSVPADLLPLQIAELNDLLEYLRTELVAIVTLPTEELNVDGEEKLRVMRQAWQRLASLAPQISRYQNLLTDPHGERGTAH